MKRIMHNMLKTAVVSALLLTATAGSAQKKRYPYVQDGKIIVCREGTDGVKASLIHPNWTNTPIHDEGDSENNRFAARFEVQSYTEWPTVWSVDDDLPACAAGWRYPTIREGRLIIALRDELDEDHRTYWSDYSAMYVASARSTGTGRCVINCLGTWDIETWLLGLDPEQTDEYLVEVVCVRDL